MSLYPIKSASNVVPYNVWNGVIPGYGGYNSYLRTPPRIYDASLTSITSFYYDANYDQYILHGWGAKLWWPGWFTGRWAFNAETLEFVSYGDTSFWVEAYTAGVEVGSFGKIYACRIDSRLINEVDTYTLIPTGGWNTNPPDWGGGWFSCAIVNRQDGIIGATAGKEFQTWDFVNHQLLNRIQLPGAVADLSWQDRECCWAIGSDGTITKLNYKKGTVEVLTSVQNTMPGVQFALAYDVTRMRLGVFRYVPDAVDGHNQCAIELYRPIPRAATLTKPVPVTSLKNGAEILFSAHLVGDRGEGISPYTINVDLAEPKNGRVLTNIAHSGANGGIDFSYKAPDETVTDTVELTATITDGSD